MRGAVGGGDGGDAVGSRGSTDGGVAVGGSGVGDGGAGVAAAAGVATVTTAGVATVTTAGVTGVAASVATGVTFLGLVVLGHLDALLDVVKLDSYNSVVGHAVDRSGSTVVGRDAVVVGR